jgi:uncharacterized protein (DUF2252 family)
MVAMVARRVAHPSIDERRARGADALARTPPSEHRKWRPAADRPDPIALLEQQNRTREPDLVPVRHGRMMVSPFTFFRGAARVMAADLRNSPTATLDTQLCGDAHVLNFGVFASPERQLMFDLNDFDETLPGPFEYDVKRMATSVAIAGRTNGFAKADVREATLASVTAYREAMLNFADMGTMDIWYAHLGEDDVMRALRSGVLEATKAAKTKKKQKKAQKVGRKAANNAEQEARKARTRDSLQALSQLGEKVDGSYRIVSQPPLVVPARELASTYDMSPDRVASTIHQQFREYRASLQDDRRILLERFQIIDVARKVVGVGSVGTRAFIVLLQGRDSNDPLFLQVKEATSSVLEASLPRSRYRQAGERVVQGQRMMQAFSDIYLGWTRGVDVNRYYYWRQLRDMKGSATVETMAPPALVFYARICAWTLARAHARSGDPVAIGAYLGKTDRFDRAIADFSQRYADQNERDYKEFLNAIKSGRLQATEGV